MEPTAPRTGRGLGSLASNLGKAGSVEAYYWLLVIVPLFPCSLVPLLPLHAAMLLIARGQQFTIRAHSHDQLQLQYSCSSTGARRGCRGTFPSPPPASASQRSVVSLILVWFGLRVGRAIKHYRCGRTKFHCSLCRHGGTLSSNSILALIHSLTLTAAATPCGEVEKRKRRWGRYALKLRLARVPS